MDLYHTETVMRDGSREVIILEATSRGAAMAEAQEGLKDDGRDPHYTPIKRKISKQKAVELINSGARCWASI